jgi:hypothetical protein
MYRRLTALVVTWTALLALPATGSADTLCDRLIIPEQLELGCSVATDDAGRAIVQPLEGTFRALSHLTVRALDREVDQLAWTNPEVWLERQMIIDLDHVAETVRDLSQDPDSPFGSEMFRSAIEVLVSGLEGLSRLPLTACGDGPTAQELTCRFGVDTVGLVLRVILLGDGNARYAVNIRTFNEQRLRHFTAIANSFDVR